ncbi:FUSC family protein [Ancylobacter sp. IITR112]|uniref:FUSC family protein n=1 Tax=Ancylobacter sp. IITR112 TaxID=3138073 RepID=UPI00352B237F
MAAGLALHQNYWVGYALLTCILGFTLDTGGTAAQRAVLFATAGLVVLAGAALGAGVAGHLWLTAMAVVAAAALYALVEAVHPSAAFAARFFCLATAIAALDVPFQPSDVVIIALFAAYAWLVSVGWDMATGLWRPSTAPTLAAILAHLRATRGEGALFAGIVAVAVALSFLTGRLLGLPHPHWAVFAVVIVLRDDTQSSRQMMRDLALGTVLGAGAAVLYGALFTSPAGLMVGLTLAALVRWPGQLLHGALGMAAMAAFIILLLQLVGTLMHIPIHAAADRIVDISLGCGLSLAALLVNARLRRWLGWQS